jgi:CheY-like chemotaxis protein
MTGMSQATTILIIDDNVNLAQGFAQVLPRAGYAAHTAAAGSYACTNFGANAGIEIRLPETCTVCLKIFIKSSLPLLGTRNERQNLADELELRLSGVRALDRVNI